MKIALALAAAALTLGACASTPPNDEFAAAHTIPGVSTRAEVTQRLGQPYQTVTLKGTNRTESTYGYRDVWGYAMALFVTYDDKGIVVGRYAERLDK